MPSGKITTADIRENGKSAFAVDIDVSGHKLAGDEPEESGGGNLGPSPYDLLTAALGECTVMTVRWYARQQNWPLEQVSATVTYRKEGRADLFDKTVEIKGDRLTPEQKQKLLDVAAKCPVQRTLEGTPVIKTSAK